MRIVVLWFLYMHTKMLMCKGELLVDGSRLL